MLGAPASRKSDGRLVAGDWGQGHFGSSGIEGRGRQLQWHKGDKLALPVLLGLKVVGGIAPQKINQESKL